MRAYINLKNNNFPFQILNKTIHVSKQDKMILPLHTDAAHGWLHMKWFYIIYFE